MMKSKPIELILVYTDFSKDNHTYTPYNRVTTSLQLTSVLPPNFLGNCFRSIVSVTGFKVLRYH